MILIQRISDGEIMHDQLHADWNNKAKLAALQAEFDALPGDTAPDVVERKQAAITVLEAQHATWIKHRIDAVVKMFGGTFEGYQALPVPPEEEFEALMARYITEDGGDLTYINTPQYVVSDSVLTVNPGWVKGNYRLTEADVTDFGAVVLAEPLYLALVYAQSNATEAISVQLLTRAEEEEFAALPSSLTFLYVICEGRVNLDNSITLSGVV